MGYVTTVPWLPYTEKSVHVCVCGVTGNKSDIKLGTFTFSHLADAFVQSDVQGREYSSYEQ